MDTQEISRDNIEKFYSQPPEGYEFAYRGKHQMSDTGRNYLKSFWNNVVNEKEARQDAKNDRAAGLDHRNAEMWAGKYQMHQWKLTGLLVQGKFIKKIK